MKIEIKSAEQFGSLLNALADEIVDAEVYFKLLPLRPFSGSFPFL